MDMFSFRTVGYNAVGFCSFYIYLSYYWPSHSSNDFQEYSSGVLADTQNCGPEVQDQRSCCDMTMSCGIWN